MRNQLALALGLLSLSAAPAFASGSVSGAGGADDYTRGKAIFARAVTCDSCPLAAGVSTPEEAAAVLKRVKAGEFGLSKADAESVAAFLERRYKVS